MRFKILAIMTAAALAGADTVHAGHGGIVGHPGGGAPRPTPSFNRPAPHEMPQSFRAPEPANARLGERPSFGGMGTNYRPGTGGSLVGERPQGRPEFSNGLGGVNRPNFNNTTVNRPNVNNTVVNRSNINNTVVNRTNINNTVVNRTNVVNVNRNVTNVVNNNVNRPGYFGYRPGYGGWGGGYGGWYRPNPYYGYHSGWVNGYWNGNYGWNNFGNSALGWGIGIGVAAWGIGSMMNAWGYSSYMNPYYGGSAVMYQQPVVAVGQPLAAQPIYDYSRPLDLQAPPPAQDVANQALATFDTARSAFQAGDYPRALSLGEQAIQQMPNDPMLHEFRGFCLFALGRYDQAAVPFYTVLSAGPGWDWTTLVHLYGNVEVYSQQLRTLEAYCNATPKAASARFLLGALYMTQGSNDSAAAIFKQVVALQPQDRLSAQLVDALTPKPAVVNATPTATAQPPPAPVPANAQPANGNPAPTLPPLPNGPVPDKLAGSWTTSPAKDVRITLALGGDKAFTWTVNDRGQPHQFQGNASFENDTLALQAADQPPMVGKVTWTDDTHFQFKALGGPPDDPGLTFGR